MYRQTDRKAAPNELLNVLIGQPYIKGTPKTKLDTLLLTRESMIMSYDNKRWGRKKKPRKSKLFASDSCVFQGPEVVADRTVSGL